MISPFQTSPFDSPLKMIDRRRSHYEEALNSAVVDWLTGLYNHGYFKRFLDLEINKSLRQRYPVTLIMIEIDNFKSVNDAYGHPTGDVILQELAQVVRKPVREEAASLTTSS